jgi:hypothetical protein
MLFTDQPNLAQLNRHPVADQVTAWYNESVALTAGAE